MKDDFANEGMSSLIKLNIISNRDIKEILKNIYYVHNTLEKYYTYYKKYIYDRDLLNKRKNEEIIMYRIFREN